MHRIRLTSIISLPSLNCRCKTIGDIGNKLLLRVQVLFNQASTGYVSGISYSYQGMVMQGSKLGNGFKWSTIKNIIDYEQERDRQRIHACPTVAPMHRGEGGRQMLDQNTPSINFEQVTNMLNQLGQV